jgi:hypothetical protein
MVPKGQADKPLSQKPRGAEDNPTSMEKISISWKDPAFVSVLTHEKNYPNRCKAKVQSAPNGQKLSLHADPSYACKQGKF